MKATRSIAWADGVREDWDLAPVGAVAEVRSGYPFSSEHFSKTGGIPLIRIRDLKKSKTEVGFTGDPPDSAWVEPGDLLVGMDGEFNAVPWQGERALLNQRMACVRGRAVHQGFLNYVLPFPLKYIENIKFSTTVKHLSIGEIRSSKIPIPPADEQRAIADFLDRETAKIDTLIEKKQRLLELLDEKRTALITRAVTRGLDPDVPTKDSGVEWIGEIPGHWEVAKIKHVARMESGHTPDRGTPEYWDDGIGWVSLADSKRLKVQDVITETEYEISAEGIANSSARLLPKNAVAFSRDATVGLCALLGREMAVSQHFIAWVCSEKIQPRYLLLVLKSMSQELDRLTMGATIRTLGLPEVSTLRAPLPPQEEQGAIVNHCERETAQIRTLMNRTKQAIELLREYRIALVSAVVTGQDDLGQVPTGAC